ncbi:hypothetical protein K505DRAFT_327947 [Melanomma pulvis-pyrius CBS 109.77]|uniref:Uncharacterized protein n=1 Tax=Melanomma pulvis-pyrius CBS 109.77 TaxID=1314802 RepID=A0A6A6X066_9PLEO|nr:hypothetical protein K505DRAFT_327947 [Melanomma pulvis-pyrius CBS 109.77]
MPALPTDPLFKLHTLSVPSAPSTNPSSLSEARDIHLSQASHVAFIGHPRHPPTAPVSSPGSTPQWCTCMVSQSVSQAGSQSVSQSVSQSHKHIAPPSPQSAICRIMMGCRRRRRKHPSTSYQPTYLPTYPSRQDKTTLKEVPLHSELD